MASRENEAETNWWNICEKEINFNRKPDRTACPAVHEKRSVTRSNGAAGQTSGSPYRNTPGIRIEFRRHDNPYDEHTYVLLHSPDSLMPGAVNDDAPRRAGRIFYF